MNVIGIFNSVCTFLQFDYDVSSQRWTVLIIVWNHFNLWICSLTFLNFSKNINILLHTVEHHAALGFLDSADTNSYLTLTQTPSSNENFNIG